MSREQLVVQRARKSFLTGKTKPLEYRIHQLRCLLRFVTERRGEIAASVKKDLGKVGSLQPHRLPQQCRRILQVRHRHMAIWQVPSQEFILYI